MIYKHFLPLADKHSIRSSEIAGKGGANHSSKHPKHSPLFAIETGYTYHLKQSVRL